MLSYDNENIIDANAVISNNTDVKHPDIFIDVDNDGVNDFVVEPLTKTSSSKNEVNINSITNPDDSTVIQLKK